jgi:hypothetical protein
MKAYGNMSAAEKKINKNDLKSYKSYDATNHSMIPGINNKSTLAIRPTGSYSPVFGS